jgi:hypothetical protein
MSLILTYRDNVIKSLRRAIPQFKLVEDHPGKFAIEDIDRLCLKTPAAFVSVLHVPQPRGERGGYIGTGQILADVCVSVFIATRSRGVGKEKNADAQGWALAEAVYSLAVWSYFDTPQFPATNPEIQNLWSREQDKQATCIMAVAWDSQVAFGADRTAQINAIKVGEGFKFSADVAGTLFGEDAEEATVAP